MKTLTTVSEMQIASLGVRTAGNRIGLVPTMGALHEGHLSMVRRAMEECDVVVASIFVNPLQFGPEEDYRNYPRDLACDSALLAKEGVHFLFAPAAEEVFPDGFQTTVRVGAVAEPLEGEFRPGHFDGVATVVAKLFTTVQPHRAYFGQKDAQQCAVLQRMTRDLNLPVEIVICPTVREPDGLAMSSRNWYLKDETRQTALVLHRALCSARDLLENGTRSALEIEAAMREVLGAEPLARTDYAAVVDAETLLPVEEIERDALAILAVWIGSATGGKGPARLLDNIVIRIVDGQPVLQF